MIWSDGQGLGKNRTGRLVTRRFEKVVCIGLSERAETVNMFVSQATAHPNTPFAEVFGNEVSGADFRLPSGIL